MAHQRTKVSTSCKGVTAEDLMVRILAVPSAGNGVTQYRKFTNLMITGDVDLSRAKLDWPVIIERCTFRDVNLTEASVPQLAIRDCTFHKLTARHLEVSRGNLDLRGSTGTIDISGAHIRDDLDLTNARPKGNPCALRADGIHVGGDFVCANPPNKSRFICDGQLSLDGAEILGSVNLEGARLNGTGRANQRAVSGEQMKVGREFKAKRMKSHGGINLIGLQVVGELNFRGTRITSRNRDSDYPTGVRLDRCHIGGSLFCDEGFSCIGGLCGIGSTIDGSAYFDGATLTSSDPNERNEALNLNRAHIQGILTLCHWPEPRQISICKDAVRLRSTSNAPFTWNPKYLTFACDGVINLSHATIDRRTQIETSDIHGKPFSLSGGETTTDTIRVALDLNQLRTQVLSLSGGPQSESGPPRAGARIDLTGATLGILLDYLIDGASEAGAYPTILKGCTYSLIHSAPDNKYRLAWLDKGSNVSRHMTAASEVCYRKGGPFAQPYQQVADAAVRAGNDTYGRAVLWRMNEAVNRTRIPGRTGARGGSPSTVVKRAWDWIQDATIGYGYRPGLAAIWLAGLWVVGAITFWHWPPASTASHPWIMSNVEHLTYPLDLIIPIVGFGQQGHWRPIGLWPQILAAMLIALGWIFSITVLAAITRIARRS